MGKKYKNLKEQICSWDNLLLAYKKTCKGKRYTRSFLQFQEYDLINLKRIQQGLIDGSYQMDPIKEFYVFEPKSRLIKALSFRDRVVQHAICNIIEPIFDKTFLSNSYACRKGKGTHAGVKDIQSVLRKYPEKKYFLKTDFSKFFHSIQYDTLFEIIRNKIKCSFTIEILRKMLPVGGSGLPIGWLISQLFANVYANTLDSYLQFELKVKHWFRYMDDIIVIHEDPKYLVEIKDLIKEFISNNLGLTFSKWSVKLVSKGINYLGYRVWNNYKLIRKDSVKRAKQKLNKYTGNELNKFIGSWNGHIQWADCYNLKRSLNANYY